LAFIPSATKRRIRLLCQGKSQRNASKITSGLRSRSLHSTARSKAKFQPVRRAAIIQ
jgi:hypothetical protein